MLEGRVVGGLAEKVKGLRVQLGSYRVDSHRDVKSSIGNIVDNTAVTLYGARWVLEILEATLCRV